MFCRQCGKEFDVFSNEKCPICSARIGKGKRYCPECGTQNKKGANICENCNFDFIKNKKESVPSKVEQPKVPQTASPIVANVNKPVSTSTAQKETLMPQPVQRTNQQQSNQNSDTHKNIEADSLADRILKANEGKVNPFASYGKKPVSSPLTIPKPPTNDQTNGRPQNKVESVVFQKDDKKATLTKNEKENKSSTKKNTMKETPKDSIDKNVNEISVENEKDNIEPKQSLSEPKFSVFSILTIIFAFATLSTMQVFYCGAMILSAFIELFANKNAKMLIVACIVTILGLLTLYFGVSFYLL